MFFHSSSYTANPIACAAAVANLAIWRDEPVLERIARLGEWQQAALDRLADVPGLVGHRRMGTIAALEIEQPENGYLSAIAPRLMAFARENGVLLRPLGNTVYVMPPYSITREELDTVWGLVPAFLAA